MTRVATGTLIAAAVVLSFVAGARFERQPEDVRASSPSERKPIRYMCPMHPQYTSDRPGTAPCCGMRLEPVYEDGGHGTASHAVSIPSGAVQVSPEHQQLIGLRVGAVELGGGAHTVRAPGRVVPDETRTYVVNAAANGWIQEVFPVTTGSYVKKGQPLATFSSRDLMPAQQNFFYGRSNLERLTQGKSTTKEQLTPAHVQVWTSEDVLEELGMDEAQRAEIAESHSYSRHVTLKAPGNGFVLTRSITPGQRFERGEELFRIAELSRVWIVADLYGADADMAVAGRHARILSRNRAFEGRVSHVLPRFDPSSRTLQVRIELENPGYALRPDMFVDVEFDVDLPKVPSAPAEAIVDTGKRKIAYLDRGNGMFEPREVETGRRFGDLVEITSGLQAGDRIVVSGNFLLDSETRMKQTAHGASTPPASATKAISAGTDPVCGMEVDQSAAKAAGRHSAHNGKTIYFCSDHCKKEFDKNPGAYL